MPFILVVPPREEIYKQEVQSPQAMDRVIQKIIPKNERGLMYVGSQELVGIADRNCFCSGDLMNRYFPGMAGTIVVDNNEVGFTEKEADDLILWFNSHRMSSEEADRHRPPQLKFHMVGNIAHAYVMGVSTTEGMRYLFSFLDSMAKFVQSHGKELRVHHVSPDFPLPIDVT